MIQDPWCCVYDMGKFDLIILENIHYQTVQSYMDNCQHLYDKPLSIMLHSQVRELTECWKTIEFCTGATITEPEKNKS